MTEIGKDDTSQTLQKMPRDRGWAWIVLIAVWLNYIMTAGIYKSFGILFIEIQTKFDSTSTKTTLIYSLINASFSCTSLLIAILDLKTLSSRQFIYMGTSVVCLAYITSALVSNVDLLVVSLGVGLGVGQGFIWTPQMTLIGQYFDKRKGLANCVAMTGGSAGSLILPYMIGFFVDKYGFSGTMMLLAAFSMNGFVFASLMRPFPLEEYKQLKGKAQHFEECNTIIASESKNDSAAMLNKTLQLSKSAESKNIKNLGSNELLKIKLKGSVSISYSPRIKRSIGSITRNSFHASSEFIIPPVEESLNLIRRQESEISANDYIKTPSIIPSTPTTTHGKLKTKLKSVLDINVLKMPVFLFYIPFAVLIANGSSMFLSFLLPYAKDKGLSGSEINSLMTLIGVADIVTIPMWGILADRQYFRSNRLVVIAMFCIGVPACFISYYDSYGTIVVFSAFYGVFGRVYFSLSPVILVEFLGLENLRSSIGLALVMQGIFHSIMLQIVGAMRDAYGTYEHSYEMMGTFLLVGSAGILIMPEIAIKLHRLPQTRRKDIIV